jgi:hypothetical protein
MEEKPGDGNRTMKDNKKAKAKAQPVMGHACCELLPAGCPCWLFGSGSPQLTAAPLNRVLCLLLIGAELGISPPKMRC